MKETTMTLPGKIVRMAEETRGDDFNPLLFKNKGLLMTGYRSKQHVIREWERH